MGNRAVPEGGAGPLPRAVALAGPTASGKTAAAMMLARRFGAEIVSVDSALVYRGMDIGTAKPTAAERAEVPHHLVDILDPAQAYSAAGFVRDARAQIAAINARGRPALLVGGTMLYFKALFEGLDEMPPADAAVRAGIEGEALARGWPTLHRELAALDPTTAARLAPHDGQRIQRALEVFRLTGAPISALHRGAREGGLPLPLLSLEPADRAWLHDRIERRFAAMLAEGLVDEVRRLRARGDLHAALPSMRCVGYRQAWALLDACEADGGPFPVAQLQREGSAATRQLAKRQLTWLRGMPHRMVVACDAADALEQVQRLAGPLLEVGA